MNQKKQVRLRVYRGKTLTFNEQGQATNENHIVSIQHDTHEWKNFLAHIQPNGFVKVVVEEVLDLTKQNDGKKPSDADYYQKIENFSEISAEVKSAMSHKSDVPKTAEQLRIEELETKYEELLNTITQKSSGKAESINLSNKVTGTSEELAKARVAYKEAFPDKTVFPAWSAEEIYKKIEKAQTKK